MKRLMIAIALAVLGATSAQRAGATKPAAAGCCDGGGCCVANAACCTGR